MKFSAIKFLDPIQIEAIYRKCNIDKGLIVEQVQILCLICGTCPFAVILFTGAYYQVIYCRNEPQVSKESSAERQGIRTGDILQCLNGVYISTMVEVGEVTIYYVPFK